MNHKGIYSDALIDRYSNVYHFNRLEIGDEVALHNRIKPYYDRSCIFMYQLI